MTTSTDRSDQEGVLAVARGFNASIFIAVTAGLVIAVALGLFSDVKNLLATVGAIVLIGALQYWLKRGWVRSTSIIMMVLLFSAVIFSMYRFGSISIAQASLAGVPLIYSVLILGVRTGFWVLMAAVAGSGWITWMQISGRIHNPAQTVPEAQWVVLTVGLVVAYRMAILFKRHVLDAARRVNAAQKQLLEERQRSAAQVEEALAELKRQKYVIDQHAIVVTTTMSGHITYGNDKFIELSGYAPADFLGRHYSMLLNEVHELQFFTAVADVIARGGVWHAEECHRAKDGREFWLSTTVAAFMNPNGKPRECIAVSTDITNLRKAEELALAASRAKSEFLANMSHEIRTPMNGVIGMVDVLRTTPMDTNQQRLVNTIYESSQTLLHILNDVLDFSKIEAGKLDLEYVPLNLAELAQGTVALMQGMASARGVVLQLWVDPALPACMYGDPNRLRQVLLNLLGNAIKFTPSRVDRVGQVELRVEASDVSQTGWGLTLQVIDNGIGMPAQDVERLFQPFTQADVSTARQFGGTGLGLTITRRLVDMMQGEMRVQSSPGQGSVFSVLLPLDEASTDTLAHTSPTGVSYQNVQQLPQRTERLLLAEDNETNREVMLEQLRLLGFTADCAHNGVEALQMWRTGSYALLLTDCHMPHMDGFDLTKAIRTEEHETHRLPIIAVTANAMDGQAQQCLEMGMSDYLTKPLRLDALASKLERWLPQKGAHLPHTLQDLTNLVQTNENDEPLAVPVWDPEALTRLVGDNSLVHQRLRERFVETTVEQLLNMAEHEQSSNLPALRELAHKMKSSSRSVGAMRLGAYFQQLETCAKADDVHGALAAAQHARRAFAEAAPFMK